MSAPQTNAELGERKDSWPVMVVGGILVFGLMIFVFPRLMKMMAAPYEERAHEHLLLQSATHLKKVEGKLVAFHGAHGRYPTRVEDLDVLVWPREKGDVPDWGINQRQVLSDAWGRAIQYTVPSADGEHPFDLRCLGRDGRPGGEGSDRDISTWDWGSSVEAPWPDRPKSD
jgi:type II secretion system protein G